MENTEVLEGQVTMFELVKNNKYEKLLMLFQYLDDGFKGNVEIETDEFIYIIADFGKVRYLWEEHSLLLRRVMCYSKETKLGFPKIEEIIPLDSIKCFNL